MDFTAARNWTLRLPDDPADRDRLLDAAAGDPGFDAGGNTTGNLIAWLIRTADTGGLSFLPVSVLVEESDLTWARCQGEGPGCQPGVTGTVPPS
jgi:hypothetical protein